MKDINSFKVDNPDGITDYGFTERKTTYGNDNSGYVQENSLVNQNEWSYHTSETNDVSSFINNSGANGQNAGTTASKDSPSFTNAVSNIGNALSGAITGSVAAAVAVVVIVVATYLSMLSFNVSLVIADMNQLVFQVDMIGFDKDKINKVDITAILTGEEGEEYTQKITTEKTVVMFDNLEPNRKYTLVINGEEQTENGVETREFYKQSFSTSATPVERGRIKGYNDHNEVYVHVEGVILIGNEVYTVTVKDEQGKVVFVKDDVEPEKDFTFLLDELIAVPDETAPDGVHYKSPRLYCTLAVYGKIYAFTWIEPWEEQEYDFDNPSWLWEQDHSGASIYFNNLNGGDPLFMEATVIKDIITEPTCEDEGSAIYTATFEMDGRRYTCEESGILAPLGHDYQAIFSWQTIETQDMTQYAVDGLTLICSRDRTHQVEIDLSNESDVITITETPATCEEDSYATFTATYVYEGQSYTDYRITYFEETAIGHSYGQEPTFRWIQGGEYGYTAIVTFTCENDSSHTLVLTEENSNPETDEAYVIIRAEVVDPTCEEDGYTVYSAMAIYDNQEYFDEYTAVDEGSATGHIYGEPEFSWERGNNGYVVTAWMMCSVDEDTVYFSSEDEDPYHINITSEEITVDDSSGPHAVIRYTAWFEFNGDVYSDVRDERV